MIKGPDLLCSKRQRKETEDGEKVNVWLVLLLLFEFSASLHN